jgi:hypothetical protein
MIKHIVLFKLEESEHKNVRLQEIRDRLEALVQVIPELKEMQVGINVNPEEKWDFSLEAVVAAPCPPVDKIGLRPAAIRSFTSL